MSTWLPTARRIYPRAVWIVGDGPWASVAPCRALTVALYTTREEAEAARTFIDRYGCGGRCTREHRVDYIGGER